MAAPSRRVRTVWSDLNGITHGRYIPSSRVDHPTHHAVTSMVMGVDAEILPVTGYAADVGYPDLDAVPLIDTRRPGWEPDTDVIICRLTTPDGESLPICPRAALERAVDGWRAIGYEPHLGYELELYVLQPDEESECGWSPAAAPGHVVYGVGLGGDPSGMALAYFDMTEHMNLGLEGVLTEFSPGQLEVNLEYGPALEATDRALLCKQMTREVAAQAGYLATYLSRPHAMSVGSGLHINLSLVPIDGGPNALADPDAPHGLSSLARHALGGLISHHQAIAGLSAPLVNSYRRLRPGLIAGYWANWGLDNRISTYRVPAERGAATRIENRMPCGTTNPYLAAATMLNAALLGVVDGDDCGDPQIGDADEAPNTDVHTPETLADALEAVESDTLLAEAVGTELARTYLTLRRHDLARWEATGEPWDPATIPTWELKTYLPHY